MEENVRVGKYVFRFGIVHLLLLVGLSIILGLLEVEANSGVSIGALMGAAMAAVIMFIQDNKRAPNKSEKSHLIWFSLLASIAISIVLSSLFLVFSAEGKELFSTIVSMGFLVMFLILLFASAVCFFVLSLSYGHLAKKQYDALVKHGKL